MDEHVVADFIRDSFERQGFMAFIGASLVHATDGRCVIAAPHSPEVTQQHGLFHGGVIGAIADVAAGYAALSTRESGWEVVTIEYKINFNAPAAGPALRADAQVVAGGNRTVVARALVTSADDRTEHSCAWTQQTLLLIRSTSSEEDLRR